MLRLTALGCLMLWLAACGGGGGGSTNDPPTSNPPPATPSADDNAKAQNAQLRVTLSYPMLTDNQAPDDIPPILNITWLDLFDDEVSYKIERRIGDGPWAVLETLRAMDGGNASWQRSFDTAAATYRVSANFADFSLPLHAAPGEGEVHVEAPAQKPEIQVFPEQGGGLRVSVGHAAPAQAVDYFLGSPEFDRVLAAHSSSGTDFSVTLPPERLVSDGRLNLSAAIRKSTSLTIQRSISLDPGYSGPAVLLGIAPATTSGSLVLTARASALAGVRSVSFFANGQLLRELDTPAASGNWVHFLDPATLPSTANTFTAVAAAIDGASASMAVAYTLEDTPTLSVEGIFDGMIATDRKINIRGTFGENMPGTVLTIERENRATILRTGISPFNLEYSNDELVGGWLVTLRAQSPGGKSTTRTYRIIMPAAGRTYELIDSDVEQLLAAAEGKLLYRKHDGAVVLRDAAGTQTQLQLPTGMSFSKWWLAAGKIVAQERVNGHLHVFTGPGQTLDLTPLWDLQIARPQPSVRGEWLTFSSGAFEFSAHNLTTGITTRFPRGAATKIYLQCDMDTAAGNERLLFPAVIDDTPGIYAYGLNTGLTELLLAGDYQEVRTDGTRLVARDELRIDMAPLNNPAAVSTLVDEGSLYFLKDGVIGFSGVNAQDSLIAVALNDGATTLELATYGGFDGNVIEDGNVVYRDSSSVHSWSLSAGENTILDTSVPAMHTQSVVYLPTGRPPGALYRTTLP